ncbi:hypothetical protein KIPB_017235, partial [Kipferlia bialata]
DENITLTPAQQQQQQR